MTSAEKKAFVITAVSVSFFVYLAAAGLLSLLFAYRLVPYVGAFTASVCVLDRVMKRFPEKAENEIAADGEPKSEPKQKLAKLIADILISTLLMLSVNFALSLFLKDSSVPAMESVLKRAALGIFIYPAIEEYLFRRCYLKALIKGDLPKYVSILLQAVLFAAVHRGIGIAVGFLCGIILGVLYVKRQGKSAFFAVYASHALYNGVLYIILALS